MILGDASKNIGTEQRPIYIDDLIPTTLEDTAMAWVSMKWVSSRIREDEMVARDIDGRIVRINNGR